MERSEIERRVNEYFNKHKKDPNEEGLWIREWIEEDAGGFTSSSKVYQGKYVDLIAHLVEQSLDPSDYRVYKASIIPLKETGLEIELL